MVGVASAVAMLAKSATGLGYPLIAIPILATLTGVETAVVVVTLPNAAANLLVGWRTRTPAPGPATFSPCRPRRRWAR